MLVRTRLPYFPALPPPLLIIPAKKKKSRRCHKPTGSTFFQIEGHAHCAQCAEDVREEHKREAARREAEELKRRVEEQKSHEHAAGDVVREHFATQEGKRPVIVAKPAAKDAPKTKFTKVKRFFESRSWF